MKFEMTEEEVKTLERHKESIKDLYGEIGPIVYSFGGGGGIGSHTIKITFEDYNITKDVTDYGSW